MTAVFMSEENAGIVLLAAGVRAMARPVILALWLALRGAVALSGLWRPVALAVATVGAVALCAAFPALPAGLAITALVGWVTYPRSPRSGGWEAYAVSWNSEAVK